MSRNKLDKFVLNIGAAAVALVTILGCGVGTVWLVNNQEATLQSNTGLKTTTITFSSTAATIEAEIADNPASWTYGLMNRTSLAADAGMLFVFPNSAPRTFWMKDTLIGLDMLFIDDQGVVRTIAHSAKPNQTTEKYSSLVPVKFVLEVNSGWCNEHGVKINDKVTSNLVK